MKITELQKRTLTEFMREHPELQQHKFTNKFTKQTALMLWEEITTTLNGMVGPNKEWKVWKKTWQDLCVRTKVKLSKNKHEENLTGGGIASVQPLTEIEEAIADTIRPVAVSGLQVPVPEVSFEMVEIESDINIPTQEIEAEGNLFTQEEPTTVETQSIPKAASGRTRTSASAAYREHGEYLQKKLMLKEEYYNKKLSLMQLQIDALNNIASTISNLNNV